MCARRRCALVSSIHYKKVQSQAVEDEEGPRTAVAQYSPSNREYTTFDSIEVLVRPSRFL